MDSITCWFWLPIRIVGTDTWWHFASIPTLLPTIQFPAASQRLGTKCPPGSPRILGRAPGGYLSSHFVPPTCAIRFEVHVLAWTVDTIRLTTLMVLSFLFFFFS